MPHYQRLGLLPHGNPLTTIKTTYHVLSSKHKRRTDDTQETQAAELEQQNRPILMQRDYHLVPNPEAFNHYEFINRLFALSETSNDYLAAGQALRSWDRERIRGQLKNVSASLHAKSEELKQISERNEKQQADLELLQCHEKKISLCCDTLATGPHEKCLYDLSLGPAVVRPTKGMQDIAHRIGGWQKMAAYLELNPHLDSAKALFALRKVKCLTPANFNRLMAAAENENQLCYIADILYTLADENLLHQRNFERVIAQSEFALSISLGMTALKSVELLNQQSFEMLLDAGQYANVIASSLATLKRQNLLNQTNREMVSQCAESEINVLLLDCFCRLGKQRLLSPRDGLDFLWTGNTKALQALSLRIDEMFAYGLSLLCHDKDKADNALLLAMELKKALKTHCSKPLAEQRKTEQSFKNEFRKRLHSQDAVMTQHRAYWQVIVANIAIALTGIGLLALGVYALEKRRLFFDQTHREQLRDAIEESPWLQDKRILV